MGRTSKASDTTDTSTTSNQTSKAAQVAHNHDAWIDYMSVPIEIQQGSSKDAKKALVKMYKNFKPKIIKKEGEKYELHTWDEKGDEKKIGGVEIPKDPELKADATQHGAALAKQIKGMLTAELEKEVQELSGIVEKQEAIYTAQFKKEGDNESSPPDYKGMITAFWAEASKDAYRDLQPGTDEQQRTATMVSEIKGYRQEMQWEKAPRQALEECYLEYHIRLMNCQRAKTYMVRQVYGAKKNKGSVHPTKAAKQKKVEGGNRHTMTDRYRAARNMMALRLGRLAGLTPVMLSVLDAYSSVVATLEIMMGPAACNGYEKGAAEDEVEESREYMKKRAKELVGHLQTVGDLEKLGEVSEKAPKTQDFREKRKPHQGRPTSPSRMSPSRMRRSRMRRSKKTDKQKKKGGINLRQLVSGVLTPASNQTRTRTIKARASGKQKFAVALGSGSRVPGGAKGIVQAEEFRKELAKLVDAYKPHMPHNEINKQLADARIRMPRESRMIKRIKKRGSERERKRMKGTPRSRGISIEQTTRWGRDGKTV